MNMLLTELEKHDGICILATNRHEKSSCLNLVPCSVLPSVSGLSHHLTFCSCILLLGLPDQACAASQLLSVAPRICCQQSRLATQTPGLHASQDCWQLMQAESMKVSYDYPHTCAASETDLSAQLIVQLARPAPS